ncbi:6-carboxytetrahydropterin synthase QueD [Virgibacillus dakarensis]|uniref:6-carboxy-5,6,7,8-tetrahydropterin synthase n=1 Tax=Lentibacillus populi TaxID=1827502 RepID=A0A9W5X611_9BACI|nr:MULTISPECIES: 6-carboxytetrahydropterin synthase QueD [Bacillaceae]MBT2215591.1 6-carboxytetrahydropterin synthase QueD [Virgibacillus dakarensis]MTW85218.1 6-carboxytetrahydropterin synthase QueD [Virgibacillus dakarensis]GGB48634.1 6-carboxy-5,6,7,8-tetrahydropterin synthase [Lentibacillus populi]
MIQQIYPVPAHNFLYELNKDFHFAAAHYIADEEAGKCQYTHGHTYFVNVTIAGNTLDSTGFLINFKTIKDLIHNRFDHSTLNKDPAFLDAQGDYFPTTEVVARSIYDIIQGHLETLANKPVCLQVFLRETPTSYCIYRPKGGAER